MSDRIIVKQNNEKPLNNNNNNHNHSSCFNKFSAATNGTIVTNRIASNVLRHTV